MHEVGELPPRGRRGGARADPRRVRGAARGRLRGRVARRPPRRSRRPLPRGDRPSRAAARSSRRASCAGWPRAPPRRVSSSASTSASTTSAALDADQVVVATDGYGHGLVRELAEAIWPTRGQVIVSEPLDRVLYDRPHYARQGFDYWQQLPDGRVLLGGFRDVSILDELTDVEATTPAIQASLERFLGELIGEPPRISHRWAGIFGLTQDMLPLVGPGARPRRHSGSPAATRATATCSASPAAGSSPARSSARRRRNSSCSIRPASPRFARRRTPVTRTRARRRGRAPAPRRSGSA